MVHQIGTPEQRNVNKVADALGIPRTEVSRWSGIERELEDEYQPPADADLMTREEREAVDRIIQLFVSARRLQRASPVSQDQRTPVANVTELPQRNEPEPDYGIGGPPIPEDAAADDIKREAEGVRRRREQDEQGEDGGA
ncbi:hypothetical protein D9V41_09080 [Aeromicrobium phragmitis]|uniref:Uncharacterized protein n=1 Tax=Aeromicrobium phragmitis TaxID=2478914 RepID=A0A3L8PL27_9ACTN|nr:hypothetical protein [Aeromicrobium phragmitis]RLV56031.1 hypothetical protein D9V41_09080 [Aeromicrobium phragmitis]